MLDCALQSQIDSFCEHYRVTTYRSFLLTPPGQPVEDFITECFDEKCKLAETLADAKDYVDMEMDDMRRDIQKFYDFGMDAAALIGKSPSFHTVIGFFYNEIAGSHWMAAPAFVSHVDSFYIERYKVHHAGSGLATIDIEEFPSALTEFAKVCARFRTMNYLITRDWNTKRANAPVYASTMPRMQDPTSGAITDSTACVPSGTLCLSSFSESDFLLLCDVVKKSIAQKKT